MIYKMNKEMYEGIKKPTWKKGKELTDKEVLEYINQTFGILGEINEIILD